MYNAFWQLALFVRGQSFSVKTFDRSRNGCQVIREGAIFGGLPCRRFLSPRVSSSRAPVFSCAHYFQAPATQANMNMVTSKYSQKLHEKCIDVSCSYGETETILIKDNRKYVLNTNFKQVCEMLSLAIRS